MGHAAPHPLKSWDFRLFIIDKMDGSRIAKLSDLLAANKAYSCFEINAYNRVQCSVCMKALGFRDAACLDRHLSTAAHGNSSQLK